MIRLVCQDEDEEHDKDEERLTKTKRYDRRETGEHDEDEEHDEEDRTRRREDRTRRRELAEKVLKLIVSKRNQGIFLKDCHFPLCHHVP